MRRSDSWRGSSWTGTPSSRSAGLPRNSIWPALPDLAGAAKAAGPVPGAAGAALVDFCHTLLNTNEFIYVD